MYDGACESAGIIGLWPSSKSFFYVNRYQNVSKEPYSNTQTNGLLVVYGTLKVRLGFVLFCGFTCNRQMTKGSVNY